MSSHSQPCRRHPAAVANANPQHATRARNSYPVHNPLPPHSAARLRAAVLVLAVPIPRSEKRLDRSANDATPGRTQRTLRCRPRHSKQTRRRSTRERTFVRSNSSKTSYLHGAKPHRPRASARDRQNDRHSHRKGAMGISARTLAAERLRDHSRRRAPAALSIKALSAFGESKRAEQAMQKTRSRIKSFSARRQMRAAFVNAPSRTALYAQASVDS